MSVQINAQSFLHTAKNVRLMDGGRLCASLQRRDGTWNDNASINLNDHIGTANGAFLPGSSGFVANTGNPTATDRRPNEQACWLLGNIPRNGVWPQNTDNNDAGLNITNALNNEDGQFVWNGNIF